MKKRPNLSSVLVLQTDSICSISAALASNIKHLHQPRKYKVQETPSFYSGQGTFSHVPSQNPGEPRPWLLCTYTQSIPDYSCLLSRKLYKQCLLGDDTSHLRATGKDRYKGTSG